MSQAHSFPSRSKSSIPALTFEQLYVELRRIAGQSMRGERPSHTLQPTALVHTYLLSLPDGFDADPRKNIETVRRATIAMRNLLIDHARHHNRLKRGGGRVRLGLEAVDGNGRGVHIPDVGRFGDLLDVLHELNVRQAAVVDMRFFCGMTIDETAKALEVSSATVERDWQEARQWLREQLQAGK